MWNRKGNERVREEGTAARRKNEATHEESSAEDGFEGTRSSCSFSVRSRMDPTVSRVGSEASDEGWSRLNEPSVDAFQEDVVGRLRLQFQQRAERERLQRAAMVTSMNTEFLKRVEDLMKEHANLVFQISDLNKVEELVSKHRKWRLQELEGIRRNKIVTKYGFRRKLRHWLRMRPFSRPRGCSIDYSSPPPAIIQELEALREIGQVKYLVQMYKQRLEDAISQDMQECRQRRTTRVAPSISRNRNLTPSDSGTRGASESSVRTILGSAFRNQLEQLLQGMVTRRQQVEGDTDATPEDFEGNQSLSATEVSYGSSTLQHLERKLEKLQRLLSTCIEMQSETHRAIRQEVSASLRSDSIYNAEGLVKHSKPFQSGKCTVCCDRNIDAVMYKCGHMVACYHCSREICDRGHTCPLCRAVILEVIKTYGATDS